MNNLLRKLKKISPRWLVKSVKNRIAFTDWEIESMKKTNPYINDPDEFIYENSPIIAGIIYSSTQYHKYWIAACREQKISYRIIHLEKADWLEQINERKCDVYLVWPDIRTQEIKLMQDERLRIMSDEMGLKIYPGLKEIWLYENKRVQHYWLRKHGFPAPRTWVFYDEPEALSFFETAEFPLVFKSNHGASASGVYIVESADEAKRKAKEFLRKGYAPKRNIAGKRQKGGLYIQQYLPNVKEWRMVRIGESYFGHGKDMRGQFHSGSGKANWDMPPQAAFDLLIDITEKGNFSSMDVDIFEDAQGNMYVNELQTVFGNSVAKEQMKIDGVPGRFVIGSDGKFIFEEGSFCENHLCSIRLKTILKDFNEG